MLTSRSARLGCAASASLRARARGLAMLVIADPPAASAAAPLSAGSLAAVTAASALAAAGVAGPVHLLLTGAHAAAAAPAASRLRGVGAVLVAGAPALEHGLAENVAALVLKLQAARGYSHLLAAASNHGRNVAPRVAAKLDVAPLSDVTRVVDARTFERPTYAGSAVATVRCGGAAGAGAASPVVLTVRATAFERAAAGEAGAAAAPVEAAPDVAAAELGKAKHEGEQRAASGRPELSAAAKVVSGGRALKSADNFKLLYALADALGAGAAVGASRAAVDAGYAPNDLQVGQTGKAVAPALYVAVGVSGAIQHLAGMKDSKIIVAINKDAEAPIFQVSDYGLVADLFVAVPEMTAKLAAAGAGAKS